MCPEQEQETATEQVQEPKQEEVTEQVKEPEQKEAIQQLAEQDVAQETIPMNAEQGHRADLLVDLKPKESEQVEGITTILEED